MEMLDEKQELENQAKDWENSNRKGRVMAGILLVGAGTLFFMREMGVEFPAWLLTWKMFLVALGLVIGVKHNFQRPSWLILVLIGFAFLVQDFFPEFQVKQFVWPILLMIIGLIIIFKPKRNHTHFSKCNDGRYRRRNRHARNVDDSTEDYLKVDSVFSGVEKNIISKNFKGGQINIVFGGAEINLLNADIEGTAILVINQTFGGTKLRIPANWTLRPESTAIMGGIEDSRTLFPAQNIDINKVLILKGTTVLGGIEITN